MNENIKVVGFDLDNTIYSELDYFVSLLVSCSNQIGYDSSALSEFNKIYYPRKDDLFKSFLERIDKYSDKNKNFLYQTYKSKNVPIRLENEKKVLLNQIKKKYKTCILTNGNVIVQKNKVKNLGINNLFDKIFYAREEGEKFEKPSNIAFKKITDYFKCQSNEVIFIGDSVIKDIYGAGRFGMVTVLNTEFSFEFVNSSVANYLIKNLSELKRILDI